MARGWFKHSREHSLARRGISTSQTVKRAKNYQTVKDKERFPKTDNFVESQINLLDSASVTSIDSDKDNIPDYIENTAEIGQLHDSDKDGALDLYDCEPYNPRKQDWELTTQYDSRKSFYGKALVQPTPYGTRLKSYNTIVAEIKNGVPIVYGLYSNTTTRHIKEYLKQNGFKAESGNQIIDDYGVD